MTEHESVPVDKLQETVAYCQHEVQRLVIRVARLESDVATLQRENQQQQQWMEMHITQLRDRLPMPCPDCQGTGIANPLKYLNMGPRYSASCPMCAGQRLIWPQQRKVS